MEAKQLGRQDTCLRDNYSRAHNYLRLSLTDRCNLRCTYCMPKDPIFLPNHKLLTSEEIDKIISVFVELGVSKIRLTGGEPMVRSDFSEIVQRIVERCTNLHMTTNATKLHEHFDLVADNFRSLNISLDTLRQERFQAITQRTQFDQTLNNLDLAFQSGLPLKLNMVVVRDVNHDEILDFIKLALEHDVEIRFIEFMPFKGNQWNLNRSFSHQEILNTIRKAHAIVPAGRAEKATAERWELKNGRGSFGIISTVSHPFCADCNRLRLTADGRLKNCLFSNDEIDLLKHIDNTDKLKEVILQSVARKQKEYGGNLPMSLPEYAESYQQNRSMVAIGG